MCRYAILARRPIPSQKVLHQSKCQLHAAIPQRSSQGRLVTLSTYRRYTNNFIYLSIYARPKSHVLRQGWNCSMQRFSYLRMSDGSHSAQLVPVNGNCADVNYAKYRYTEKPCQHSRLLDVSSTCSSTNEYSTINWPSHGLLVPFWEHPRVPCCDSMTVPWATYTHTCTHILTSHVNWRQQS